MTQSMLTSTVLVHELSVAIDDWPTELAGLRIAHVSDFHFRRWNETLRRAQSLLANVGYDLLLFTGDFGTFRRHWQRAAEITKRFFDPLAGLSAIYAVLGNHDDPRIADGHERPITFLRNKSMRVDTDGGPLNIAGIEQTDRAGGDIEAALASTQPGLPTILLAHYPSTVFRVAQGRVQLVLSGHTHGGQIRLPWLGCVWPNDRIPRRMASGLHQVLGTKIHVSAGIGASLPLPLRINCPPEFSVLTMQPTPHARRPYDPAETRRICRSVTIDV